MKNKFSNTTLFLFLLLFNGQLSASNEYFNEGINFYKQKEFEKAKFKFEQDIVYNPKNENSYLYLSKIFREQKEKELEEKNLNTVIMLNPKNEEANYNLAKLKLEQSDFKKSKKLIDQLIVFCKTFCQKSEKLKVEIEKSLKK
ncbi:MAG: hypothetical protein CBC88_00530 [Candidatus Pelagibacter sp. TMED128]|nr:MAG: hypothetical protein CBC88_00530 [Candidatus Pelagibacter sp. TMED128]|tara:strand:- start:509 stop:937 length:429 start_codon:yes stop_codon:yes gene_type:complete